MGSENRLVSFIRLNLIKKSKKYEFKILKEQKHQHGIGQYCDMFLKNNINGKRLLMMKKNDLRNIGITSEGHIIDLHVIAFFNS